MLSGLSRLRLVQGREKFSCRGEKFLRCPSACACLFLLLPLSFPFSLPPSSPPLSLPFSLPRSLSPSLPLPHSLPASLPASPFPALPHPSLPPSIQFLSLFTYFCSFSRFSGQSNIGHVDHDVYMLEMEQFVVDMSMRLVYIDGLISRTVRDGIV
uniref:Uncharacterized protein n=1 Tax=Guillardia theta TaxID=55529 RepID=A0A7S4NSD5_GUITH|mmetsp:Transcript_30300/g.97538  ORF Transcript_30300/g.97538 Transcript_30300/m.97538 type:complete len:155 (+) Transcript_30300:136-600(+)